jgi:hypothetical protein
MGLVVFFHLHKYLPRSAGKAVLIGTAVLGVMLPAVPANAQGLFDFFFGGYRRAPAQQYVPPQSNSYVDPFFGQPGATERPISAGRSVAYCVRLCDGHFFPIQRVAGASPAELCKSFCPAAKTKTFSGSAIDYAVAQDGTRYEDLDNAFVYRERTVSGCTCNGKDVFGLVQLDANSDPTLRPGDMVATTDGIVAFAGSKRSGKEGNFTPVRNYSGLSSDLRRKLSETKVAPPPAATRASDEQAATTTGGPFDPRRAQLSR